MSKQLSKTVGNMEYDNLIYDVTRLDTATAQIKTGQGLLKRGSVLCADGENKCAIFGHTLVGENSKASYILTNDVDTGTTTGGAAIVAEVYRAGHFSMGKLITHENVTLTQEEINQLREYGIVLSNTVKF